MPVLRFNYMINLFQFCTALYSLYAILQFMDLKIHFLFIHDIEWHGILIWDPDKRYFTAYRFSYKSTTKTGPKWDEMPKTVHLQILKFLSQKTKIENCKHISFTIKIKINLLRHHFTLQKQVKANKSHRKVNFMFSSNGFNL